MNNGISFPVIIGPTASGKTALSVALAHRLNAEVVSADSMQIYDTLYIGTARPDESEQEGIPHHLMGYVPLSCSYNVAHYVTDAKAAIADIVSRGKLPLICGGTGLYVESLLDNRSFSEQTPVDAAYRLALQQLANREGNEILKQMLMKIDPESAARLHTNDRTRLIRALELYHISGVTMTEQNRLSHQNPSPYNACVMLLTFRDRQHLYDRIDRRVDYMLEQGLLEEARQILSTENAATAMQAIGYKELAPYFDGEISLDEAIARIKQGTRRYAKRQLSWFRHMDVQPLYREDYASHDELVSAAENIWLEYIHSIRKKEAETLGK